MIRTSTKFARPRVRNFTIFFWITLIITRQHLSIQIRWFLIFNFSSHVLNTTEKSLLSKGLDFAIPRKNINYADCMIPFELLYRDVDSLDVSNLDKQLRHSAFLSYKSTSKSFEKNLPKAEFDALKILFKNWYIIIQKAVKVIQSSFWTEKIMFVKWKTFLMTAQSFIKLYRPW